MSTTPRTVKFKVQTQAQPIVVNTSARTLKDLKEDPAVKDLKIEWSKVTLVERKSKSTLELDDAVLPATDCLIFVSPKQTKAGADKYPYKVAKAMVKELIKEGVIDKYNYTHDTTKRLNKIIKKNKAYFEDDKAEQAEEVKGSVTLAVKGVSPKNVKVVDFEDKVIEEEAIVNIVELVTEEDLDKEAREIQAALKK